MAKGGGGAQGAAKKAFKPYRQEKDYRVYALVKQARDLRKGTSVLSRNARAAVGSLARGRVADARRIKAGGNVSSPYIQF